MTTNLERGQLAQDDGLMSPAVSRALSLTPTVVLVDGISRSGKSLLCPILASFERVEIERAEEILEYIGDLYAMGKIERDAAVTLLRLETDMHLYNAMIGRNTNFRFGDHSSVWSTPNPLRYLTRLLASDGQAVVQRIATERPIYQDHTHDQLTNFALFDDACWGRLRMIEMIRHPVELVDSWMRRGWGTRFGGDPTALTICIEHHGQELPYYALGWEELYVSSTPLDRVIRMVAGVWDANQKAYHALTAQQRPRIFVVAFEEFIQHPRTFLEPMATFLGTRTTRRTAAAVRRQRCPRRYSPSLRQQKQDELERQASSEEREILSRLIEEYEVLAGMRGSQHG